MNAQVVTQIENLLVDSSENGMLSGLSVQILKDITVNRGIIFNVTTLKSYNTTELSTDSKSFFARDIAPQLISGNADLAASYYYILIDRVQHNLSVLLPVVSERFRAFFVQPHVTDGQSIYLAPFGTEIAIVIYSSVVFLMLTSVFLLWNSSTQIQHTNASLFESFSNGIWGIISAYTFKSFPQANTSTSLKILLITASLFFWVMSSIYSAFLLSVLSSSVDPIHSFMDLVAHEYSIYINPSLSSLSNNTRYKKAASSIHGNLDSFKKATEGGHAHVDAAEVFEIYRHDLGFESTDLCKKLQLVPYLSGVSSGFYVSRNYNTTLKESLNRGIARLGDVGLLHYYSSKYFKGTSKSCPRRSTGYLELDMIHIGRLFESFGATTAVAVAFLGLELLGCFLHSRFAELATIKKQ